MNKELNVKVGDTVLYHHKSSWTRSLPQITKVIRITPTGRIRIELYPDEQFDKYGKRMGNCDWGRPWLEVPTAEKLQEVKEKHFIDHTIAEMQVCKHSDISYEQAVAIMKILKEGD